MLRVTRQCRRRITQQAGHDAVGTTARRRNAGHHAFELPIGLHIHRKWSCQREGAPMVLSGWEQQQR